MTLNESSKLAMAGTAAMFLIRIVGNLTREIYMFAPAALAALVLRTLASVAMLIFFVYFKKEYLKDDMKKMKGISSFVVCTLALVSLLYLYNVYQYFNVGSANTGLISLMILFANCLALLIFLIQFYKYSDSMRTVLKYAIAGCALTSILRLTGIMKLISTGNVGLYSSLPAVARVFYLLGMVFIFGALFNFYYAF